jgi:hypothetical protein
VNRLIGFVAGIVFPAAVSAGEIAGAPVPALPSIPRDFSFHWGNDAFGRTNQDDFRTQQSIVSGRFHEDWLYVIDYSILTVGAQAENSNLETGRLDQLSGSIGYRFYHDDSDRHLSDLSVGAGLRATGNFDGQRLQNGWHRLTDSRIESINYVDSNNVDGIGWFKASFQETVRRFTTERTGNWDLGYWLDGTVLASTDGQLDGNAGIYGVVENDDLRFWVGGRGDLRQGYSQDIVQSATAKAEQGYFVVLGLSLGPLILQTAQAIDSDTQSFGNISLNAVESQGWPLETSRTQLGGQVALLFPDVSIAAQLRYSPKILNDYDDRSYRVNLVGEILYGKPPYKDSIQLFVETNQLSVQSEFETQLNEWIKPYVSIGVGWRREQVISDGSTNTGDLSAISRVVGLVGGGLRFDAAGKGKDWGVQLQLGVGGWIPMSSEDVTVGNTTITLQDPGFAFSTGVTASLVW